MNEQSLQHRRAWEAVTIGILFLIIIAAGFGVYQYLGAPPLPPDQIVSPPAAYRAERATTAGNDLGSELYVKSSNPIDGAIPETFAPVPNPIQNVYKNPFQ